MMHSVSLTGPEFTALTADLLGTGHALRFRARGGSMHPFIKDGDVIEVQPISAVAIRRGDVVFCRNGGGRVVAHRVIRVRSESGRVALVIRGDALACPDGLISPEQVLGRVVALERGGRHIGLDAGLQRLVSALWVGLSPLSRWLYRTLAALKRGVLSTD